MKRKKRLPGVCSTPLLNVPLLFLGWLTGVEVIPKDVSRIEKILLFIAFCLLCFGLWQLLSTLSSNYLSHNLLFSEYNDNL